MWKENTHYDAADLSWPMTAEQQTACGLGSFLSVGCRGRAEAFARRLHQRLATLGVGVVEAADGGPSSPLHRVNSADSDAFYDPVDDSPLTSEASGPPAKLGVCSSDSDSSEALFFDPESSSSSGDMTFTAYGEHSSSSTGTLSGISTSSSSASGLVAADDTSDNRCSLSDADSLDEQRQNGEAACKLYDDLCSSLERVDVEVTRNPGEEEVEEAAKEAKEAEVVEAGEPASPREEAAAETAQCRVVVEVEEEDDDDVRPQRVRRCSSLKTGKTPPGTPSRKKIVRFADVLGLDLADVRTFLDEIPRIPRSAYDDLHNADMDTCVAAPEELPQAPTLIIPGLRCLVPLFQQPGGQPDFLDRVRERQVCLESATVQDPALMSVAGRVRVRNLDFHKSVHVRYSLDGWRSWVDLAARYEPGSCDGFSDRFSFLLYAHSLSAGGRLELAVRFQCRGAQFWDNNGGANYAFQCVPGLAPATSISSLSPVDDRWPSFY